MDFESLNLNSKIYGTSCWWIRNPSNHLGISKWISPKCNRIFKATSHPCGPFQFWAHCGCKRNLFAKPERSTCNESCNKKVVFSYEANKLFHAPNHRSDGSDRRFPNIFGITTTAELPERGALGRFRFFEKDCNNVSVLSVAISIPLLGAIILAQRTDDLSWLYGDVWRFSIPFPHLFLEPSMAGRLQRSGWWP